MDMTTLSEPYGPSRTSFVTLLSQMMKRAVTTFYTSAAFGFIVSIVLKTEQ